jgi:ADP-heptose:LPS heptosyltransferase
MHLAAAVGTPCVAIFSARAQPGMWYPYGVPSRVLRKAVECEGCGLVECIEKKNECLKLIEVDEVLSACGELLEHAPAAHN